MIRKAAGEYSKTKEEQLGQAVKAAFDWLSTCYGAITIQKWKKKKIHTLPINEIENILCDDYILQKAIDSFCSAENALDSFHKEFWILLSDNVRPFQVLCKR